MVGVLLCLALWVIAWHVTLAFQAVKTSGWFLATSSAAGAIGTLLFALFCADQQRKRLHLSGKSSGMLGWSFIVWNVVLVSILPDILVSCFFSSVGSEERPIRDQAKGMIVIGTIVMAPVALAIQKRLTPTPHPATVAQLNIIV